MIGDEPQVGQEFDPAPEIARRLVNMDNHTRERTLQIFQDMLSKNQRLKDVNTQGGSLGGASCEQPAYRGPISSTHRDLLRRREELWRQLGKIQENVASVDRLLSAFEG